VKKPPRPHQPGWGMAAASTNVERSRHAQHAPRQRCLRRYCTRPSTPASAGRASSLRAPRLSLATAYTSSARSVRTSVVSYAPSDSRPAYGPPTIYPSRPNTGTRKACRYWTRRSLTECRDRRNQAPRSPRSVRAMDAGMDPPAHATFDPSYMSGLR
jgi:hypothetical protein